MSEPSVPACGTYAAVSRHRRRGEPVDELCLQAAREYRRANYKPRDRAIPPCGTYAAAQRHRKLGEEVDEACLVAAAKYMRERREIRPAARDEERAQQRARTRALSALADIYQIEYLVLYSRELAAERQEADMDHQTSGDD